MATPKRVLRGKVVSTVEQKRYPTPDNVKEKKLSPAEQRFVAEYLGQFNATEAYLAVYPKVARNTARRNAWRVRKRAHVAAEIERQLDIIMDANIERRFKVLRETERLAFADPRTFFDENGHVKKINELDDDTAATIASIEVKTEFSEEGTRTTTTKFRMWEKNAARRDLMQHLGMLSTNAQDEQGSNVEDLLKRLEAEENAKPPKRPSTPPDGEQAKQNLSRPVMPTLTKH